MVTPAQAEVLSRLRAQQAPVPAASLAAQAGQHVNTVRQHLDALVAAGLAVRTRLPAAGRGRPAYGYAVSTGQPGGPAHAALVDALATHLVATDPSPADALEWLGRRYAAGLPASAPPRHRDPARRAMAAVVEAMRALGFTVEVGRDARSARLVTCPMLGVARSHEAVACGFHRGLAAGLAERITDLAVVELRPFAEPGACRLTATAAPDTPAGLPRVD